MNNTILQRQLQPENIEKLAAQRILYSKAKLLMGIQITLSVPTIILISIARIVFNDPNLMSFHIPEINFSAILAICGIAFTIIDLSLLSPAIKQIKEKAAKIQELFDCEVLSLQWNDIKSGPKPDNEIILKYSKHYKKKEANFDTLKDWYSPVIEPLPLAIARIICQRSNFWWDASLRENYKLAVSLISAFLFVLLFILSLFGGITLQKFATNVLAPFLPAFVFSIRQIQENERAIKNLQNLKMKVNEAWQKALESSTNESELYIFSRQCQDELFINRKENPLIFDWIYKIKRDEKEEETRYSITHMVNQYLAKART